MNGGYEHADTFCEANHVWISWADRQGLTHGGELVRCMDCKRNSATPHNPLCDKDSNAHEPYWFCADGERKKPE